MYRIVVVDDEKFARDIMCQSVERIPNVTICASLRNGKQAKEYLETHMADIIITDIRMPVMDGLELAKWIRNNNRQCEIILVSGYEDFEYARQAINFGVKCYLLKPFESDEISAVVNKLIQEKREKEKANLFSCMGHDFESEKMVQKWVQNPTLNIPEIIQKSQGTFLIIEENRNCPIGKNDLENAFRNVIKWTSPCNIVVYIGKKGWNYQFLVISKLEESSPDISMLEERMFQLIGYTFKILCAGIFTKPNDLILMMQGKTSKEDRLVSQVEQYVAEHMQEDISRDLVAAAVYMESSYFSRCFKNATGENFKDYLHNKRMEEAKRLLKKGLPVNKVRQLIGYADRSYFNKVFKQHTGVTPIEYRNKG